ncbi:MAG: hypothetical protein ACREOI_09990 [bacterium]
MIKPRPRPIIQPEFAHSVLNHPNGSAIFSTHEYFDLEPNRMA